MDALEIVLAERLVPAAFQSGAHGTNIVGKRSGAHRTPGFPAAGASGPVVRSLLLLLQRDRH
jgi:hypothetical protein